MDNPVIQPMLKTAFILLASALAFLLFASQPAMAARGGGGSGGHSMGVGILIGGPSQADTNAWVNSLSTVGTKEVGSAYEFFGHYEYRFTGSIFALQFRPSYFTQEGSGGGVEAKLSGFTFFPILRLYPLENSFIKFFFQVGVGYGTLNLKLKNATGGSGNYDGGNFGALAGLGSSFCFTPNHCAVIEGNFRYLPMSRNVGNGSGLTGAGSAITQENGELELNSSDLATTLSGIQGGLSYLYTF